MNNTDDHKPVKQLVRLLEGRVIDFQDIPNDYESKEWITIPFNKSTKSFFKKHGVELDGDLMIAAVVNQSDKKLVQTLIIPTEEETPIEMVFENKEKAQHYLRSNQIKPSLNVVPEEFRKQVEDFFNGKVCFFKDAQSLYEDFIKERDSKTNFNAFEARKIVRKYEHKIIDILFDTIPLNK